MLFSLFVSKLNLFYGLLSTVSGSAPGKDEKAGHKKQMQQQKKQQQQ